MLKKILTSVFFTFSILLSFNCHVHEPSTTLWCVYVALPGQSAVGDGKLHKIYSEIHPSRYPDKDGIQRVHSFYKCRHENEGARIDCPKGYNLVIREGRYCSEEI